jgi:transcriptional regulator with GAF, ATPase, and Fis domain/pSer/pThr/pTyr-binding forkhead associated (FHA) protein
MEPKLIAIAGPLQGKIFVIPEGEGIIGRESDWLVLSESSASRRHCVIDHTENGVRIRDLGSRNGTFINRVPIQEKILQEGDCVEIGNSLFLFRSEDTEASPVFNHSELTESQVFVRSTVRARIEDILQLQPDQLNISPFPSARVGRALQVFWKVGVSIGSIRDLEMLCKSILQSILEFVPAKFGAILLANYDGNDFVDVYEFYIPGFSPKDISVSRTLAIQVLKEPLAIVAENTPSNSGVITSVLCAPLVVMNQTIGVLYLDTASPGISFDEDQLQLVTTVAGISGAAIENCRQMQALQNENQQLKNDLAHDMIGESPAMQKVYDFISRVASTNSTVLIFGETGTGKELAARAIHQNSQRSNAPFVAINCAALSETLLESELFGHEKGSFTGAIVQKKGKFELAHGGTVFLDEVAELSQVLQAKLLRFLQERQFERVGGIHAIQIDIRLIAATNKNLENAVSSGSFREDLYYRLNVLKLLMPPLRERIEDIPLLASHFAAKYSKMTSRPTIGISPEARRYLACYRWPGNVRELENAIERAVVLGAEEIITPEDLPEGIIESQPENIPLTKYHESVREAKRRLILKTLEQTNGNYVDAAKILGLHVNNVHRLIRDLNLKSTLKS